MVETLLFRKLILLLKNLILLFGEEGLSLTFQKTILRTSFIMLTRARHDGDVRGLMLTLLLSIEWFLFINVILLVKIV